MFGEVVVPLDGSVQAARALEVSAPICRALDVPLRVVAFAMSHWVPTMREEIAPQVADLSDAGVDYEVDVRASDGPTSGELANLVREGASPLVCMTTHGRGRSEALVGSVANAFIRTEAGPALLIGPAWGGAAFDPADDLMVTIDGSRTAEAVLPTAQQWAITFGNRLEIVTVLDPAAVRRDPGGDTFESSQVMRLAHQAQEAIGRTVDFEVLHGTHPARVLCDRIADNKIGLAAMTTHGTSGLARVAAGSVTSEVIRHATCPVLTLRPTGLDDG